MTTIKEKQIVQKYHQENGNKPTIVNTEQWDVSNKQGMRINTDYFKVMTLDFYLFILDQIPD